MHLFRLKISSNVCIRDFFKSNDTFNIINKTTMKYKKTTYDFFRYLYLYLYLYLYFYLSLYLYLYISLPLLLSLSIFLSLSMSLSLRLPLFDPSMLLVKKKGSGTVKIVFIAVTCMYRRLLYTVNMKTR